MKAGISPQKIILISALYISQSVPTAFLKTGFQLFLKDQGINYETISRYLGLLLFPWAIKFLWAPLVDRFGNSKIGHRKSWIIPLQVAGGVVLGIVAFLPLESSLMQITLLMLAYSFICATQDIAVDGLAVLSLSKKEHGWGNSIQMGGYYLGELLGGAVILVVFHYYGWTASMLALAVFFLLPLIPLLSYKETSRAEARPLKARKEEKRRAGFIGAILDHFKVMRDYLKAEEGWWIIMLVIFLGSQVLAKTLIPSMLSDKGMSAGEIGLMVGVYGNSASIIGAILGGMIINQVGRKRSLIIYGLLKIPMFLLIFLLDKPSTSSLEVALIIAGNDFIGGLAAVSLFTIMMDKCRLTHPGSDFSIQQSINTFGILIFVILSGILKTISLQALLYTASIISLAGVFISWKGMKYKEVKESDMISPE